MTDVTVVAPNVVRCPVDKVSESVNVARNFVWYIST